MKGHYLTLDKLVAQITACNAYAEIPIGPERGKEILLLI